MQGFSDKAKEAGTRVTGGQSVRNPWCIIGGVVSAVVQEDAVIWPIHAQPGDVLVLTKPLGTQVAVRAYDWWLDETKRAILVQSGITQQDVHGLHAEACASMARLNKTAAELMAKYKAHGATDITGFGLLGHAGNLVANQKESVSFVIDTIPVLTGAKRLEAIISTKLTIGRGIETSGGLLVVLDPSVVEAYCRELKEKDGWFAHVIGRVVDGPRQVVLSEKVRIREHLEEL